METYWVLLFVVLPLVAATPQGHEGSKEDNEKREPLTERPNMKPQYYYQYYGNVLHPVSGYYGAQAIYPTGNVGFYPGSSGYPGYGVYYPSGYPSGYNPNGGSYPGYYPSGGSYPGYYPGSNPGYNPSGGSPGYNPSGASPGNNPDEKNPVEPEFSGEGGKIPNGIPVDNEVELIDVPPNRRGGQPSGGYPGYPGVYPG